MPSALPVMMLRVTVAVLDLTERAAGGDLAAMAELEALAGILAARRERG